ncbi:MAG: type IV toxin-antitoxin system AbiEi family antitoxin domain-containing protein, partial [Actinobacteria bacterium]|nr:type IV toxin-antitoxin system AbiEi family antitoxin domain-containing protein [Actinomycetota bacterium]
PIRNQARRASRVADLAGHQEGLISRRQLEARGLSPSQIKRRLRDGRLLPVFHGVFALGHAPIGSRAQMRAAVLACPGAVISHRSAAALLGFGKAAPVVVDLIPPVERGRKIQGIKPHRVPFPRRPELVLVVGIPCTNAARTIVDLAGTYGEPEMRDAVERAATE